MTDYTDIAEARKRHLEREPFDPHKHALPSFDKDEELVEDWIGTCLGLAKSPELTGILFANVFRGMNLFLGSVFDQYSLHDLLHRHAVDAWEKDFGSDGAA
ncbi:hypothetical protein [Gordonia sp. (in: high G+C Gram-positive bacteria)]|uniref:hypothetical protein n=1 Tax=Gordonia sp. (in: high G+C Gram-positive bacteria) TaxID=84139 RepID=UPI0039E5E672